MTLLLSNFERGRTPLVACSADPRFSYCLYVPSNYDEQSAITYPLLVAIHSTEREAQALRDAFISLAEQQHCLVLAPLFPGGIIEPDDLNNFKLIQFHNIRFDVLLLAMVDEVARRYRIHSERFLLHGFSGGGQFAHRFFYLHPDRLLAVSIGAPGAVTLLDHAYDWWTGVANMDAIFGRTINLPAMQHVKVQTLIGEQDTQPSPVQWGTRGNIAGVTRMERLVSLRRSLEQHGITVHHHVVAGVGHNGLALVEAVSAFFAQALKDTTLP